MPLSLFTITVKEYTHIPFDAGDAALLQMIIWGFCIGAILAAILSLYQQSVPGKLVRALLRAEAHTAETAKTLEEIGLAGRPLINRELRCGTVLKKFVLNTQDGAGKGEHPISAENGQESAENGQENATEGTCAAPVRYYIPEELKYRAATRYEKKGNAPVTLLVTALLAVAMAVLLMKLIPPILSMIDAIL